MEAVNSIICVKVVFEVVLHFEIRKLPAFDLLLAPFPFASHVKLDLVPSFGSSVGERSCLLPHDFLISGKLDIPDCGCP